MAENTTTATRRHQRQRSSVQIKKRVSLQKPISSPNGESGAGTLSPRGERNQEVNDNAFQYDREEPKDNLLSSNASSPNLPNPNQVNSIQTLTNRTHSRGPSFNPQHGSYENPVKEDEEGLLKADYFSTNHPEMSGDFSDGDQGGVSIEQTGELSMQTNATLNEHSAMGDMTTRAELDLFDDDDTGEDQAALQSSSSPPEKGPELPLKEESGTTVESLGQITTPIMGSQEAANGTFKDIQKAKRNSNNLVLNNSAQSTPSSANKGAKRLSLLINNGLSNSPSSPSTSPRAIRTPTASTPRSGRKAHRMSLGYFPSPDARSSQSPTPYSAPAGNGSMPTSNTSSSGSIAQPRFTRSTAPRSASVSTTASFDSSSIDGETILSQHKGVLERIAEKERAILELKETLAKEEKELVALRVEWQKSAARELAGNGRSSSEIGDRSERKGEIRLPSLDGENVNSLPTSAASDTFKGLSAKLQSGIGTQFNAFLDQLVNVPPTESVSSTNEASSTDTRNTSLGSLLEEDEEEGGQQSKSRSGIPPPVPSKTSNSSRSVPPQTSKDMPKSHSKRSSIFGASFAAIQKQMEQQFAPVLGGEEDSKRRQSKDGMGTAMPRENKEDSQAGPSSNDFSWGNLSKKFKEARENASGYLAMAEARLGQAMTIDDLLQLDDQKQNERAKSDQNNSSTTKGFAEENDREKAALAELSWLNSMAGIKMSGSVDRVTTSVTSPNLQSTNGNLNQQNLLRLEDARRVARAASPASSSQSTTRPDHSPNGRGSNVSLQSPPLGVTKLRRTSASGVGPMKNPEKRTTGIFDVLSAVWLGEKSPGESSSEHNSATSPSQRTIDLDKNKKRLSGQSRTRFAARAALDQGESGTVLSPRAKENVMETAWDWDAPLQPLPETGANNGMGIGLVGMHEESSKRQSQSQSRVNRGGKSRPSCDDLREINLNDRPRQDLDHFQSTKSNQKKDEEEENWSW